MLRKLNRFLLMIVPCFVMAGCGGGQSLTVTVINHSDFDRQYEVVELAADSVLDRLGLSAADMTVVCDRDARETPFQLTHDGKIIFPVSAEAGGKVTYSIRQGVPAETATVACGRRYPERLDDLAWENDRSGYRLYGPAAFAFGGSLYGYDIFTKNVARPVLEERYALDLSAEYRAQIKAFRDSGDNAAADSLVSVISYHVDHGEGMDAYDVGPTLGAGMAALMTGSGELLFPRDYVECEVLDNGPLRFTAKLSFAPQPNGAVESRTIELDMGSYLNKTVVKYGGLTEAAEVAAGCVVHKENPEGYRYSAESGFIAYADSTNNPRAGHGVVYVGLVFPTLPDEIKVVPLDKPAGSAVGHVIAVSDYSPGSEYTYYWGSGWSHAGLPDLDSWTEVMRLCARKLREPLEVVY